MEILKLLDVKLVLAHVICFLLVLGLLKKFLWKPIFDVLEARRRHIESQLRAIEDAKADAARLKEEYAAFLAKVELTARERLKAVQEEGALRAQEIRDKARQEAARIMEEAQKEVRVEWGKTRESLKAEVVNLVILTTERVLSEKLTLDGDRRLVESILDGLERPE